MNIKYIVALATLSVIITGCSANSNTSTGENYFPEWYQEILAVGNPASVYEDELYSYYEFSDHMVITKYKGSESTIEIPSYINGKPVTEIGSNAFEDCTAKNVIIPETVTSLGTYAFEDAEFTHITIPETVNYIDNGCFKFSNLETIDIKNNQASISSDVFSFTPLIENASDPLIINNILIKHDTAEGEVVIPDGIVNIVDEAFANNANITSVVIPESVTSIGHCAFERCSNLRHVEIKGNIENVGNAIFLHTQFADEASQPIIISNTLVHYPKSASGEITLGKDIDRVAGLAFYGCNGITALNIPDDVEVDSLAVMGCDNLIEVNGISIEEYKFLLM